MSALGSPLISGASRWLEAKTPVIDVVAMTAAPITAAALERVDMEFSPGMLVAEALVPLRASR